MGKHMVCLHLGSNLGDRIHHLNQAIKQIEQHIGNVYSISNLYETDAWGNESQDDFYNLALLLATDLPPVIVLEQLLAIEDELGRIREERWGPRIIDIDLIYYDDCVIDIKNLKVPHPRLHLRKFVLIPLMDIIPFFVHPTFRQTTRELLAWSQDDLEVRELPIKLSGNTGL